MKQEYYDFIKMYYYVKAFLYYTLKFYLKKFQISVQLFSHILKSVLFFFICFVLNSIHLKEFIVLQVFTMKNNKKLNNAFYYKLQA